MIPLVIAKEKLERVKEAAGSEPLVSLTPYKPMKAGIVTTGNEVYYGRIKDTFTPVIIDKLASYGIKVSGHILCDDNMEKITNAILQLKEEGADLILCTGGMSVDPDDQTPGAIKQTGARIVSYGAPVLPGAMFLLAYLEKGFGPYGKWRLLSGLQDLPLPQLRLWKRRIRGRDVWEELQQRKRFVWFYSTRR